MSARIVVLWLVAGLSSAAVVSGCTASCGASTTKLQALRRGMSYDEVSGIMGCPGKIISPTGPDTGAYATVEWDGPDTLLFKRTQLDFADGKLLSYTSERRGGL
ncbi:MAG: hypothetical protein JOY81_00695 [Alphaproteobacteria bacterium]|nr:hypothetical protein [Alphaproteobacteria bacterium]